MDDEFALTKEQLYEKRSLETLESELWRELNDPHKRFSDKYFLSDFEKEENFKDIGEKVKNYKIIYKKVIEYNNDDMKLYRSYKHNAEDIVKYVNEYIKNTPQPDDNKTYTCLYICRDYGESGCLYMLLDNVLCYQSYINAIKRRFPDFDVDKEYPWRMWVIVRDEAVKRITENINKLYQKYLDTNGLDEKSLRKKDINNIINTEYDNSKILVVATMKNNNDK